MKIKRSLRTFLAVAGSLLGLWLLLEIIMRIYLEAPLETGFYSSVPRAGLPQRQAEVGVRVASGSGWIHLGWIADPENETYRIEFNGDGTWQELGQVEFGSFLHHSAGGTYRVWRVPKDGGSPEVLGEALALGGESPSVLLMPRIAGEWQSLFRPQEAGYYINDHTIYQDAVGDWRLAGITSRTDGDFNQEKYFAAAVSDEFPPVGGMTETAPLADFGGLAWAPHVIHDGERYHMFWSPHELHQMTSEDGITWENHTITMPAPYHKFFRDGMVLRVAPGQWLLYTTARGAYYSQVDIYQSFDLTGWQYIGPALRSGPGSERNSPFSSMESPFVVDNAGRYYLALTYNNDSFFWPGILLTFQVWPDPGSYNETLVFHSDNPYDFGIYRGRGNAPSLLTELETHAPEFVFNPGTGKWYITTAGWPWVATLTSGEAAVAPLEWEPVTGGAP
ncbi:MAG: hypothetical protein FJZ96_11835 [Chloroflexi bacterium]|nr:hypothetical protein [Chloroflexota bacterium]